MDHLWGEFAMDLWGGLVWIGRIVFAGLFVISGVNHFRFSAAMTGYARAKHVPAARTAVFWPGVCLFSSAGVRWREHCCWDYSWFPRHLRCTTSGLNPTP